MLTVTYEYLCDVCKEQIHPDEVYHHQAGAPLCPPARTHVLGFLYLCDTCAEAAVNALEKRMQR